MASEFSGDEHTLHEIRLHPGEFLNLDSLTLSVPLIMPKKSQVRIPQSSKKDYCRLRFSPILVRIAPSSPDIIHGLQCVMSFQHCGSTGDRVASLPLANRVVDQNELKLESRTPGIGPEATLREKGSWQVFFQFTWSLPSSDAPSTDSHSLVLRSDPIRIYGSNYQKELAPVALRMQRCAVCAELADTNEENGSSSNPDTPVEKPKLGPSRPPNTSTIPPPRHDEIVHHSSSPAITLPSIRELSSPRSSWSNGDNPTLSPLRKRSLSEFQPSQNHNHHSLPPTPLDFELNGCHSSALNSNSSFSSLEEKRRELLRSIDTLQGQLKSQQELLVTIDQQLTSQRSSCTLPSVRTEVPSLFSSYSSSSSYQPKPSSSSSADDSSLSGRAPPTYAILFGTNFEHLRDARYHLRGAENDVRAMAQGIRSTANFRGQAFCNSPVTLCGASATRSNLLSEIVSVASQIRENQNLLLFFATYGTILPSPLKKNEGVGEEVLIAHDALSDPPVNGDRSAPVVDHEKCIFTRDLRHIVDQIRSQGGQIVLMIDSSFPSLQSQLPKDSILSYLSFKHSILRSRSFPLSPANGNHIRQVDTSFEDLSQPGGGGGNGYAAHHAVIVILATQSCQPAVEIMLKNDGSFSPLDKSSHGFPYLTPPQSNSYGLFTWVMLKLWNFMGKAGDLHDLFEERSLSILLNLLCDALLRERTSPAYFPVVQPRLNHRSYTNGNRQPPLQTTPSWKIVKVDKEGPHLKAECLTKTKYLNHMDAISCLVFRNSNLQDVVGLVDLVSPPGRPTQPELLDGIIRLETDQVRLTEGQVLFPIQHGAAFLHHHIQLEDSANLAESQALLSVLKRSVAPYKTWICMKQMDCALPTPTVYVRYSAVAETWEARLVDHPAVRIFGSQRFSLEEVDRFLVCVAQYVRYKIVLLYVSLPFFYDTAQVQFTVEPSNARGLNLSSHQRYHAGDLVHYQVQSWENQPVYVSVLWFQSDGSIVLMKDCEQLAPRCSTNGVARLPDQARAMIVDGGAPCSSHIFCLFVSSHFCSFESLQQQIGHSSSLSASFLLSLPVMKADNGISLASGASWHSRGFCSLLHSFEIL